MAPREEARHTALVTLIKEGAIDPAHLVGLKLGVEDKDLAIKLSCCQPPQEVLLMEEKQILGGRRDAVPNGLFSITKILVVIGFHTQRQKCPLLYPLSPVF